MPIDNSMSLCMMTWAPGGGKPPDPGNQGNQGGGNGNGKKAASVFEKNSFSETPF